MLFINWIPEYNVGIDELDRQHRDLVKWINQFHEAMGKPREGDKAGIILSCLRDYVVMHFPAEEEFLKIIRYPHLEQHKKLHSAMASEVMELENRRKKKQRIPSTEVLELLRCWITDHVQNEDGKYSAYLKHASGFDERFYLIWNADLRLDGDRIDSAHEEMIRLFNRLHAALSLGDSESKIEAHLNDFFNFCQTIFADEEELMERIMYSHYEVHRADHESLLGRSYEIRFKLKSDSTRENAEGLKFLAEWIIEHIEGEAARYVNYVNQNNVSPETMFATWDRNYSIDIDEFDSQHKKLLKSINHIHDLDGSDNRARGVEHALNQLINDVKFHTFAEEDLMRKIKYPKADWHKKEHEKIIKNLLEIQKNHILGKAADPVKLANLLKNWLIDHIHSADKDYSKFFRKDAINLAKLFVSWDQSLSVGLADLDKQHKNIFHILNQLHAAMNIESERKNLSGHLENLASEIKQHFHAEEDLMTKIDYPHLEDHQKAHRKLIKQVKSLQIWTKQERAMTARKDLRLIKSWLIDHIKYIDMKYARFIARHQPERANQA